jgi:sulfatase maturation enzyme AslB (radical SAM superfamily)
MSSTVTLHREGNPLADPAKQLIVLQPRPQHKLLEAALAETGLYPLRALGIEVLQVNLGKLCNMTCSHCHVDAGPDRREIMTRETAEACVRALAATSLIGAI